jgi:di/tricarboxylate transporter
LLIPLAYGGLMGGMLTLIGGTPNLVANDALRKAGREGFHFFSFTPIGLTIVLVALVYLVTLGDRLLPERIKPGASEPELSLDEILKEYEVVQDIVEIHLPGSASWRSASLGELRLRSDHHIDVLALREVGTGKVMIPTADTRLNPGAVLFTRSSPEHVSAFCSSVGAIQGEYCSRTSTSLEGRGIAEVLLTHRSKLAGKSLAQLRFFQYYGVKVVKVRRAGQALAGEGLAHLELRFADTLLVEGPWTRLLELKREQFDFVVVGLPMELHLRDGLSRKAGWTLFITAGMLLLMTSELLSPMLAAVLAATLLVLGKCITVEEAYRSVHWGTLILVATMMPMGTALAETGGIQQMTHGLLTLTGNHGPWLTMAGIYFLTTMLGQVMSNTATAVIMAPLAMGAASQLQVAPEAFLMALAYGGSSAFLTPIASPGNTLVVDPGAYRFGDFLRVGLPLQAMSSVICLVGIPLLYPLEKI